LRAHETKPQSKDKHTMKNKNTQERVTITLDKADAPEVYFFIKGQSSSGRGPSALRTKMIDALRILDPLAARAIDDVWVDVPIWPVSRSVARRRKEECND
jgi:hypothetical protein